MPRKSFGPSGSNGQPPSASDWLLWCFHKNTRVWKAFDAACKACNEAGVSAGQAWQQFAEKIFQGFQEHGFGAVKFDQSGHESCFDDLEKMAYEAAALARQPSGDASRNLLKMMVRVFLLLLPSAQN